LKVKLYKYLTTAPLDRERTAVGLTFCRFNLRTNEIGGYLSLRSGLYTKAAKRKMHASESKPDSLALSPSLY
jgi:hypothetical protein